MSCGRNSVAGRAFELVERRRDGSSRRTAQPARGPPRVAAAAPRSAASAPRRRPCTTAPRPSRDLRHRSRKPRPRHACRRHLFGELDRGERLEQREEWSAEQSRLLAGDDGDGPGISQRPAGFDGARRGAAALLLRVDDRRDLWTPPVCPGRAIACPTRRDPLGRPRRTARQRRIRTRSRPRGAGSREIGGGRPAFSSEVRLRLSWSAPRVLCQRTGAHARLSRCTRCGTDRRPSLEEYLTAHGRLRHCAS